MNKEIDEIIAYLERVNRFSLPEYKELPNVDLYMEQVLAYVNGALADLSPDQEKILTSFMVNNYVKAGMIDEPIKKKYSKDQIGYLLAISLLKQSLAMSDISALLELDNGVSSNKEQLYRFFRDLEAGILTETSRKTLQKVDGISRKYKLDKRSSPEEANANARNGLGFIALRLAVQAEANKLLAEFILARLRAEMHGEEAGQLSNPSKRELRADKKGEKKKAKRINKVKKGPKAKKGKKHEDF